MNLSLTHHQFFSGIPSASGLAFYKDRYYIVGDDATQLFILNADLTLAGQLPIPGRQSQARIPKPLKKDWESLCNISVGGKTALMSLGSGSLSPHRNAALLFYPETEQMEIKDLSAFYRSLRSKTDLNIEAATEMGASLLIGNRGNLSKPKNLLIFCSTQHLWEDAVKTHVCRLELPQEPEFSGISGLAWLPEKDWLFFTTSKEETANTYDDGKIGESRVGVIKKATRAVNEPSIKPDEWIRLEEVHPVFKKQKIESIVLREISGQLEVSLVSDNDDGGSHVFRLGVR